tara:strand:+ start:7155 stop:7520 length:366 start_codon:yes stop_codon:yes gene_type:complete
MTTTKKLDWSAIRALAASSTHQSALVEGLYAMALPVPWDQVERVKGYPKANKKTCDALIRVCFNFDLKHHPNVMPGGAWMNNGFSALDSDHLADDFVEVDEDILVLKEQSPEEKKEVIGNV